MWRQGVMLEGRKTRAAKVCLIKRRTEESVLEIVLQEGRNRQIRRIAQQLGYPVIKLHRTAIGPIQLQTPKKPFLSEGKYRSLKDYEIHFLQDQIAQPNY
ncbi:hypothetical protein NSTCB13_04549 [Nostoc sp. DSM 114160]|jgi:pseudouridine synthase